MRENALFTHFKLVFTSEMRENGPKRAFELKFLSNVSRLIIIRYICGVNVSILI